MSFSCVRAKGVTLNFNVLFVNGRYWAADVQSFLQNSYQLSLILNVKTKLLLPSTVPELFFSRKLIAFYSHVKVLYGPFRIVVNSIV